MKPDGVVGGSFRDPAGTVFRRDGVVYRQVNAAAAGDLRELESSGLYELLTESRRLVRHDSADEVAPISSSPSARVIRPEQIPFISYPYEWCFGQLKDAALLTLDVQLAAMAREMSLKDASAFNVQFLRGRPILIDTLSLTRYAEGAPWVAYRQFCEHFLAPLLLIAGVDPWLGKLSSLTADGIPLETASRLLPRSSWLRPKALLHVHLHARSIRHFGGKEVPGGVRARGMSRRALQNLVEGLRHVVAGIEWTPDGTEWADYETEHGYDGRSIEAKRSLVAEAIARLAPARVWDLGANTGDFSRVAAAAGAAVVAMDFDPAAVERNYLRLKTTEPTDIHPLWMDLRNPSSDLGWAENERDGLRARADADCVMALALVHHLAIGGNVPLPRIIDWMADLAPSAIVEFVPKSDPQVRRLLVSREDVFSEYDEIAFEALFAKRFEVVSRETVGETDRILFTGRRRGP